MAEKKRKPAPVPNGHDDRGKDRHWEKKEAAQNLRRETQVPHGVPEAPDGVSGDWT